MRHRKSGKRLGVPSNRRKAMLKQLVEALFLHGRIRTTLTRAKVIRPIAEKVITWAKRGGLHHRRHAMRMISRKDVVNRIFDNLVEWYKDRAGGYTRIIKIGQRMGDAAPIAFLELVDWIPGEKLPGQHTKVIKVAEDEEGKSGKAAGKDKPVKEKAKPKEKKKPASKSKPGLKKAGRKTEDKKPEKEKKITERKMDKEKIKKELAAAREKVKKEKTEQKTKRKAATPKPAGKKAGKAKVKAVKVKKIKKKTSKQIKEK
ncbi:50S ribosomal protein L17 [bacterium]|nr:50S ribosomal protein L17 [bacterium]